MRLLAGQIIIPREKLTDYLLVFREKHDKSAFLNALGYYAESWHLLAEDLKTLATSNDAVFQQSNMFGDLYSITGKLRNKSIVTIWIIRTQEEYYRFVTLFPEKQ